LSKHELKLDVSVSALNPDFVVPESDFSKVKLLGKGAYGKVMHIYHKTSGKDYACKRFE